MEWFDADSAELHIQVSGLKPSVVEVELGLAEHGIILESLGQFLVPRAVVVLLEELRGFRLLTLGGWQVTIFHA